MKLRVTSKTAHQSAPSKQEVMITLSPIEHGQAASVNFTVPVEDQDEYPIWSEVEVSPKVVKAAKAVGN